MELLFFIWLFLVLGMSLLILFILVINIIEYKIERKRENGRSKRSTARCSRRN